MSPFSTLSDVILGAKTAVYRSEGELNEAVRTRIPDSSELRTIAEIEATVRTNAKYSLLNEFFSRETLITLEIETVDNSPPYSPIDLQKRLRRTDIPVIQVFSKPSRDPSNLPIDEHLILTRRDESNFVVLIKIENNFGQIEQWIRDLDIALLNHLRKRKSEDAGSTDTEYDPGERIKTSITAYLNRASKGMGFQESLLQVEQEVDNIELYRHRAPEWYMKRIGSSAKAGDEVMKVKHSIRIGKGKSGTRWERKSFTKTENAIQWLRDFNKAPDQFPH